MPLQDRFLFRFGFILTVVFILFIFVNPCRSFAGDATQVIRENYDEWEEVDIPKLAERGDAEAQDILGNMYYNGQGVPQDYKEAARWYRKAAEQGDAEGTT